MKRSWILALCFSLATFFLFWLLRTPDPFELPVSFSRQLFPMVDGRINGRKLPLAFALISKHPLCLDKHILESLRKERKGSTSYRDVVNHEYTCPQYALPQIHLGPVKLQSIITIAQDHENLDGESVGMVAWPFHKAAALVDLPHGKLWGIRNKKQLQALGYDLSAMQKIPISKGAWGIQFTADTEWGPLIGYINTGCNFNVIRADIPSDNQLISTEIRVSDTSLGKVALHPYEISPEAGLDLLLGADFLRDHIVYVDLPGGCLYIGGEQGTAVSHHSPTRLPLQLTHSGLPVVEVEVDHKKYPVMVDTGLSTELILTPGSYNIDSLNCVDQVTTINALGEKNTRPRYILPQFHLGKAKVVNAFLCMDKNVGVSIDVKSEKLGTITDHGYLGRPLLERTNLYFDFNRTSIWLVDSQQDLRKLGVDLNLYEKVPFDLDIAGMVLTVSTDLGELRFLLDTGATWSVIKPEFLASQTLHDDAFGNSHFSSNIFALGTYDFGGHPLYPLEFTPQLGPIDGILGADFLRKHPCYIDYQNRAIYFQRPS